LSVILAHLLTIPQRRLLASPNVLGGLILAVAVPALWFGLQFAAYGADVLDAHFAFVFRKVHAGDSGALRIQVWPYLSELLKYYWPWLPVFAVGAYHQLRERKDDVAALWALAVFATAAPAAIPYSRYLIPAYPAMAILSAAALERWIPEAKRAKYFAGACTVMLLAGAYTALFPAPERGLDIRALAPIAETSSGDEDRLLLYTHGERLYEFQNQLLWYADRNTDHVIDMAELASKNAPGRVGIIDKTSFPDMPGHESFEVLGESDSFLCYRVPSL
jgi:hypothetical protein